MRDDALPCVAAVVMASGYARRMGANKLLFPLGEATVIEHVLDQVSRIGYDTVVVVSQYDRILAYAGERGFFPVDNPDAAEGKSSSIRRGIDALQTMAGRGDVRQLAGITFFTGDQVLLSDALLIRLLEAFRTQPDRIVFPLYAGELGSPGTFPLEMTPMLMKLNGEEGGRKAVAGQEDRIITIQAQPSWQGDDFDTPRTWAAVQQHWASLMPG